MTSDLAFDCICLRRFLCLLILLIPLRSFLRKRQGMNPLSPLTPLLGQFFDLLRLLVSKIMLLRAIFADIEKFPGILLPRSDQLEIP